MAESTSESSAPKEKAEDLRFPAEEEAALLSESHEHKAHANSQFALGHFDEAIQSYDKALAVCPNYCDYEISVLRANIAAAHLKQESFKDAEKAASDALEGLSRLDGGGSTPETLSGQTNDLGEHGSRVAEVDDDMALCMERLEQSGHTLHEVQKLRVKALLRRARAREWIGGWASLAGADEDYKQLMGMQSSLSPMDAQTVRKARAELPPRLEKAKQEEMGEMMGKLKNLGNGILRPFGLSTDNFALKQEESGGYSVQFKQDG